MKDWQAFLDLKKKIDDFNETCPLLEMMSNKAMAERHWHRISVLTKKPLDIESDNFTLGWLVWRGFHGWYFCSINLGAGNIQKVVVLNQIICSYPRDVLSTLKYVLS